MKKDIHPEYYPKAKVSCACGNSFTTGATVKEINVELCSACHPFYTGKQKLVDTARRVEKFEAKMKARDTKSERKGKKAKRAKRAATKAKAETKAKKDKK
jgi:large subunit ribosomal protein L31